MHTGFNEYTKLYGTRGLNWFKCQYSLGIQPVYLYPPIFVIILITWCKYYKIMT